MPAQKSDVSEGSGDQEIFKRQKECEKLLKRRNLTCVHEKESHHKQKLKKQLKDV